jgi:hypothetical protein
MKNTSLILGLLSMAIFSQGALATSASPDAEKAFSASPQVQAAIKKIIAAGYEQKAPESVEIAGSCGFAGCSSIYLVVQRFSTKGANTQTDSIIAEAHEPTAGDITIKIVKQFNAAFK